MYFWRIHKTETSVASGEVNRVDGRREWEGEFSQNILLFLRNLELGEYITYKNACDSFLLLHMMF